MQEIFTCLRGGEKNKTFDHHLVLYRICRHCLTRLTFVHFLKKKKKKNFIFCSTQEFDKKYNPTWHCIVGRNFGSYVTHETKHFIYFYLGQVAILLFKSGWEGRGKRFPDTSWPYTIRTDSTKGTYHSLARGRCLFLCCFLLCCFWRFKTKKKLKRGHVKEMKHLYLFLSCYIRHVIFLIKV